MKMIERSLSFLETQVRKNTSTKKFVLAFVLLIAFPFSLLLYVARVRILQLTSPGRIGHLCTDVGMFVKRQILGLEPRYHGVLISRPEEGANQTVLDYWRRHVGIVNSAVWSKLLQPLIHFRYLVYDAQILAINETAPQIAVESKWGDRPPLLSLEPGHRERGRAWLAEMGVPFDGKFVCVHTREPGYGSDDHLHSYRNASIESYLLAAAELRKRGLWCIRMGAPSVSPLPRVEGVVDYARSKARSDWLDVFLCADCEFFLGGSSGLIFVANLFGRPCAAANQAPLSSVLAFSANDVAIPKLLWSENEQRYLTFAEAFRSDVSNFRFSRLYEKQAIRAAQNAAEDVRDLAIELLERTTRRIQYTAEDEERQRRFKSLFRPGHYGYGGVNRVGREFLRKYEYLLKDS